MRIVAGEWRGRPLVAPGGATRPTSDRTRETLFSMLISRLGSFEGLRVADLFAGSGALGLEALSRGATHCMFVEQDPSAIRALRRNITSLRAQEQCDVRATSVMAMGPVRGDPLDLVLLDPPYETHEVVAIDKLTRLGWIAPSAWISLETSRKEDVNVKGYTIEATRDVGKARLHLLRPAGGADVFYSKAVS